MPTPADALKIMEPPLLRWLYARRRPNQSFKIAFDQEIQRLYDEWDTLDAQGRRRLRAARRRRRARPRRRAPPPVTLPRTPRPLPYRTLASVVDITTGARGADAAHPAATSTRRDPLTSLDEVRPRLDRAEHWITTQVPGRAAHRVRDEPDTELLGVARRRRSASRCACCWTASTTHWSLDGLTTPRLRRARRSRPGLPLDAKPTPELKVAQRDVLRAALPPAGRPRHRPAPAHAAAGGRRRPGPHPAHPLTRPRPHPGHLGRAHRNRPRFIDAGLSG